MYDIIEMRNLNNRVDTLNGDKGNEFVSFVYAFSPILLIYSSPVPGLSINEFIIALLFIWFALTKPNELFKINSLITPVVIYILYGTIITFGIIFSEAWSQPSIMIYDVFSKILFLIIFFVGIKFISFEIFIKNIFSLGDITVTFLFIQIVLSCVGVHISGIIPFLPLSNEVDTAQFISGQLGSDRMSSLFSEPAHLSEFLLLPLIIELFDRKRHIFRILLYGSAIIISKSTTGFSVLGVILILFLIYQLKTIRRKSVRILLIVVTCIIALGIAPLFLIVFGDALDRFSEISGDANGLFSGYIRVMRGYVLFGDYSLSEKIFGQGFGCILGYISSHKTAYLDLTDKIPEYVNSIQYILITTGIIGLFIIFKFIYGIFTRCSYQFKMVLLSLIIMMTSSSIFFSTLGCLYLIASIRSIDYFKIERNNQRRVTLI